MTSPPPNDSVHSSAKDASLVSLTGKALRMLAILTLVTGVVYPLLVTGIAGAAFADQANGSIVSRQGTVVGSRLIGQPFDDPRYFWGRLSATSPAPYNGGASSGSNMGPTNPALTQTAKRRIEALRAADPGNAAPIPVDLVSASASGLDPHITPAAAEYQLGRVSRARGLDIERVRSAVQSQTERRILGTLGEPRVNVLLLNLALDELK